MRDTKQKCVNLNLNDSTVIKTTKGLIIIFLYPCTLAFLPLKGSYKLRKNKFLSQRDYFKREMEYFQCKLVVTDEYSSNFQLIYQKSFTETLKN